MNYQAIIFDLDGTLLDTIDDIASSMNAVLDFYGFPMHEVDKYKLMVGDGMEMLVRRALPENHRDDSTVAECSGRMNEIYTQNWHRFTKPYPGIESMLTELGRDSVRMAILSNKPHDFTRMVVSQLLGNWEFEQVLGAREGVPKKPDPSAALEIAQSMSLSTSKFLYCGDTGTDMKTAVGSGMHAVGVLWGFRDAHELTANGARILLKKPEDIFQLLQS